MPDLQRWNRPRYEAVELEILGIGLAGWGEGGEDTTGSLWGHDPILKEHLKQRGMYPASRDISHTCMM